MNQYDVRGCTYFYVVHGILKHKLQLGGMHMSENRQNENNFVENTTEAVIDGIQSLSNFVINTAENAVGTTLGIAKNLVNSVTNNIDTDNDKNRNSGTN